MPSLLINVKLCEIWGSNSLGIIPLPTHLSLIIGFSTPFHFKLSIVAFDKGKCNPYLFCSLYWVSCGHYTKKFWDFVHTKMPLPPSINNFAGACWYVNKEIHKVYSLLVRLLHERVSECNNRMSPNSDFDPMTWNVRRISMWSRDVFEKLRFLPCANSSFHCVVLKVRTVFSKMYLNHFVSRIRLCCLHIWELACKDLSRYGDNFGQIHVNRNCTSPLKHLS